MLECDPGIVMVSWDAVIDRMVSSAKKNRLITLDHITITKPEIKRIESLQERQLQRLAFTLLCIARFKNETADGPCMWVNTPDREIMKMANINTSIRRQSTLYAKLHDEGMIRFSSRVDNTNVEVLFAEDGDAAIEVSDFRNLGYQYLMYHGEDYFVCEECGITEKSGSSHLGGRKKKYCQSCAAKIHMKQKVDSVMRRRGLEKSCIC